MSCCRKAPASDVEAAPKKKGFLEERSKQVFYAQLVSAFLAMCGTACGVAFMLLFARANTCNTTGPSNKGKIGYYASWSVLLKDNPLNCVVNCPADCYNHFTQADLLKQLCQPCVDYCISSHLRVFPWSTNIDTCPDDALCSGTIRGITSYCRPIAKCVQDCASPCINNCIYDKYHALWLSIAGLILFWLAFFALPCCGGVQNMTFPPVGFLAVLPLVGATILFGDLWLWNMKQKGWTWVKDDTFKNVTPNYMPGLIMCLCLIGCLLMMIAYWNVKDKTRETKNNLKKVGQKDAKKAAKAAPTVDPLLAEPPKVIMAKPTEHNVTIGLEFAIEGQEVSIKGISDDGPAFQSVPNILIGDVVHKVWDEKDPEPAADHHWKASIESWAPIVKKAPAGTKCFFEFYRKSENKSYTTYIVRKERPANPA